MDAIGRKALPHEPPLSIGTGGQIFFITVCAAERDARPLMQPGVPEILLEAAAHRNALGVWFVRLMVVMPDHVHALLRVPREGSLSKSIANWKRWTSTQGCFGWQRDFFDHRLRNDELEREKADYILRNPVRAGLVERWEDWPWVWMADRIDGGFIETALPKNGRDGSPSRPSNCSPLPPSDFGRAVR